MQGLQKSNIYSIRNIEIFVQNKWRLWELETHKRHNPPSTSSAHTLYNYIIKESGRWRSTILGWWCPRTVWLIPFFFEGSKSLAKLNPVLCKTKILLSETDFSHHINIMIWLLKFSHFTKCTQTLFATRDALQQNKRSALVYMFSISWIKADNRHVVVFPLKKIISQLE